MIQEITVNCNLCADEIDDIRTAGYVLPWGSTCQFCLADIYGEKLIYGEGGANV